MQIKKWVTKIAFVTFFILIFISFIAYHVEKHEAMKKFYPEMTYREYMLLEDNIRITPKSE